VANGKEKEYAFEENSRCLRDVRKNNLLAMANPNRADK
jgi:hypothetical protein